MISATDLEKIIGAKLEAHLQHADSSGRAAERTPANLAEAIRYSLFAPGKRIRPRLTLACSTMLELPVPAAQAAAVALEMIHCFTLIHDDLPCMDNDDFRRGRPSNHKVHGEALALLAGDGLMSLALDSLLDAAPHVAPDALVRALARMSWAMGPRGVIGGQAAEAMLTPSSTLEELRHMHFLKTGALFLAALLIPKDLAGIATNDPRGLALDRFAEELGLAFQAVDDLEDLTQDQRQDPSLIPSTSILRYLSADSVRKDTGERLGRATRELSARWGESAAAPLVLIADEVARKLA